MTCFMFLIGQLGDNDQLYLDRRSEEIPWALSPFACRERFE